MIRPKLFGLALLTVLVAGVMTAAAASAESTPLPDIHTALPGERYPLYLGGRLKTSFLIRNAGGAALEGQEISVLLIASELTTLGEALIELLEVMRPLSVEKCKGGGGAESHGEVLLLGAEYHLVYTNLSPGETLAVAALILFDKLTVACNVGLFEVTITGPATARINVPTPEAGTGGDSTDIEVATHCRLPLTTGLQEISYYYNDTLSVVPTTLLMNVSGTGDEAACAEVAGTLLLTPETGSLSTMFSVLF